MKRSTVPVLLLATALLIPTFATAAQIKAHIAQFTVTPADSGSLKTTLQTLLSSRIASDSILPVATASEADVLVTGSYTQFGKVFSLDVAAKLPSGSTLATVFEQGESQDDLIPALGKITSKLKAEMVQRYAQTQLPAPAAAPAAQLAPAAAPAAQLAPAPQLQSSQAADQRGKTAWLSQRIAGAQVALAPALTRAEGREIFVAEANVLRLYRQEKNLKLVDEVKFSEKEKIIAIDSIGSDQIGTARVYVTIVKGDAPASKIFSVENGKLKPVASELPYLFRAIALNGGKSKIYAQQMGVSEDYFGDLFEVSEVDGKIEVKNPIKLPRYANVFNYNRVSGPDGTNYATVLSSDGQLIIYTEAGEEIWRSSEKFGGSETFFMRETGLGQRDPEDKFRWRFLDQRITVTKDGEVIVPQNGGFFVLGNSRSYSKHALVGFQWNGSSLEESWRTKQSQNYLADYYLDAQTGEIVELEVVQKEGIFGKGGSAVRAVRVR